MASLADLLRKAQTQELEEEEEEDEASREELKKLLPKIDLNNNFSIVEMTRKANAGGYLKPNGNVDEFGFVCDLLQLLVDIQPRQVSIMKAYNARLQCQDLIYKSPQDIQQILSGIFLKFKGKKKITAWNVYNGRYKSLFCYDDTKFNDQVNDTQKIFSIFQGWKWNPAEEHDEAKIKYFLNHVLEVISDGDKDVYNYIISWIANIAQHPGKMNKTAIILKNSSHGAGKNVWFTDILAKMFKGYSDDNITDLESLTKWNSKVEHKVLCILNEAKNHGENRFTNFDTLKSIITDPTLEVKEKHIKERSSENVINIIFSTNNDFPVKIETGDRRYLVLNVNGKYKDNTEYFLRLEKERDAEGFYEHLLKFFLDYDISKFNSCAIPKTEAKQDMINAGRSAVDLFIVHRLEDFIKGILKSEIEHETPKEYRDFNSFHLALKGKCEFKQNSMRRYGKKGSGYILREEYVKIYTEMSRLMTDGDDDENEI